jgi:hypothetical protein
VHRTRRVPDAKEARQTPALGLERVHGKTLMAAPARMNHMISTTAFRSMHPGVHYIECQWRMNPDFGMQRRPRLPGAKAHTRNVFSVAPGRAQRQRAPVAGRHIALRREPAHLELDALERGVDITHRAARRAFLAEHVPGLERLAQLQLRDPQRLIAELRKAELEMRREPLEPQSKARAVRLLDHLGEILPDEVRQHEAVVQLRSPAREPRRCIGLAPEARDQRAQQQQLHQAHARVRRHLECAQLQKAHASARGVGRVQLVDAELGAVRVAGHVDEEIPQ